MKPRALLIHATGTNRDYDVARALELAGASPEIVHINALRDGTARLLDYQLMVLPGGFSYGDDLGAGKLWAIALRARLGDDLEEFVAAGRPVIGICNGFQALVKSGLLPALGPRPSLREGFELAPPTQPVARGESTAGRKPEVGANSLRELVGVPSGNSRAWEQQATLTRNESGRFECRWVELVPEGDNIWTGDLDENIYCPVAHGEGRFLTNDENLAAIEAQGLVAVRYSSGEYPANPNGSMNNIAGISNPSGNVLGLMPHPENHIAPEQHPRHHHGRQPGLGLALFQNGVKHAGNM